MTPEIKELLPLYALGILAPDEEAAVEQAIAADPALASELASYRDAATLLVVPVTPSPAVKTRLMASIGAPMPAAGASRFEQFTTRLGKLFDVSVEHARELLGLVDRPASWEAAMPGIGLVHFDGGPAYAAADCGFVRLEQGATFPRHTHRGEEVSLILSGQLRAVDSAGERIFSAGDELVQAEGSEHELVAVGGECVFAARAMNGIEIGGAPMRPSKPDR
jgi:putative transcriptional regulator